MSKPFRKAIAVCIGIMYILSVMTSAVYAAPSDISKHAAESVINRWISKGLAKAQADGKFRPNEIIKRIEFITYINKIFNFTEKAKINLVDVITDSDDGKEIAKAVAAGYIQGDSKKKVYPYQPITKVDAAVILAKVFDLKTSDTSILNRYSDSSRIPLGSREAISALLEKGYISGGTSDKLSPWSNLTRADSIVIIDKIIGTLFNSKGTYKGQYKGNVVINTKDIALKDATIEGDLYLTEGIADGDITLDNVIVKGRTFVFGGGKHSIIIRNSSLWGPVSVDKKDGLVRLVAEGTANIYNVELSSGAILEESSLKEASGYKGFDVVHMNRDIPPKQEVKLEGNFSSIVMEAPSIKVQVDGDVGKLQVKESGESSNIKIRSGTINEFNLQSYKTILDLVGGTITTLNISSSAAASSINVDGSSVGTMSVGTSSIVNVLKGSVDSLTISSGATGSIVSIAKNARVTNLSNSAGASVTDNRGSVSNSTVQYISLSAQNLTVIKGNVSASIISVSPSDAIINYSSLNPTVATVNPNNGIVTGINTGTATILVTASKTGYATSSSSFTVTVNDVNINAATPGTLIVSPTSANRGESRNVTLSYTPGEALSNGTVVFNLPTGFSAVTSDMVSIAGGSSANLNASQISNSGRTVTITGLNLTMNQAVTVTLINKTIPTTNSYVFTATADVDGTGPRGPSTGTGNEAKTLASTNP